MVELSEKCAAALQRQRKVDFPHAPGEPKAAAGLDGDPIGTRQAAEFGVAWARIAGVLRVATFRFSTVSLRVASPHQTGPAAILAIL